MKKNLIALAVLAVSGVASAQSSVTLYGAADVWFGGLKVNGVRNTVVDSAGVDDSFFGLKGTEDLGGGLKANFVLEQSFQLDSGAANLAGNLAPAPGAAGNQAFSRQSYVGFSSAYGELRLGKTFSPFDEISGATTPGFDSALAPTNFVWASTGYNVSPSNTVYYATPTYSGFSGAASYSLGEDKNTIAGKNKPSRTTSFNVKYANGPVYAGLAYQAEKTAGTGFTEKYLRLNGSYDFGVAKLLAGYGRLEDVNNINGEKTTEWQIGVDVPVSSALTVSGGYARSKDNGAVLGNAKRTGVGVVALYSLSKRTAVYGGVHASKTTNAPANKVNIYGVGVRHAF